jgi:hypothetical protein
MAPTCLVGVKAKAIDKVLQQQEGGFEDVIVWPFKASADSDDDPRNPKTSSEAKEEDEAMLDYGYGDAEPNIAHSHTKMPRRSSLSNQNDANRRAMRRASIGYTGEMTLVLPNTKAEIQKRRSITFSDDQTVHSFETMDDPDADDEILNNKRQLWFRDEEYRHIERNIRNLINDTRYTKDRPTWVQEQLRGLESVLDDDDANRTVAERHNTIQMVLEDQERQRQGGYYDEHAISAEYQYNSMDATVVANERAKQDEQEIQGYMEKTKQLRNKLRQQRRMSC